MDCYKQVVDKIISENINITGKKIKRIGLSTIKFDFNTKQQSFAVANRVLNKINTKYGNIAEIQQAIDGIFINIVLDKNTANKIYDRFFNKKVDYRELSQFEREHLERMIEGNWSINEDGDIVPFEDGFYEADIEENTIMLSMFNRNTYDYINNRKDELMKEKERLQILLKEAIKNKDAERVVDFKDRLNHLNKLLLSINSIISEVQSYIKSSEKEGKNFFSHNNYLEAKFELFKKLANSEYKYIRFVINEGKIDKFKEIEDRLKYFITITSFSEENKDLFGRSALEIYELYKNNEEYKYTIDKIKKANENFRYIYEVLQNNKNKLVKDRIEEVGNKYLGNVNFSDYIKSRPDISWLDLLFFNPSQSISVEDSPLTSLIRTEIRNAINKEKSYAIRIMEKITRLGNKLMNKLPKNKPFDIFYQKKNDGKYSGFLINRYNYSYISTVNRFVDVKTLERVIFNKLSKENNVDVYNFLMNKKACEYFNWEYNEKVAEQYHKELKELLGEREFKKLMNDVNIMLNEYILYYNTAKEENVDIDPYEDLVINGTNSEFVNLEYAVFIPSSKLAFDNNFDKILEDNDLYEFYKLLQEAIEYINKSIGNIQGFNTYGLPYLEKTLKEVVLDKSFANVTGLTKSVFLYIKENLISFFSQNANNNSSDIISMIKSSEYVNLESRLSSDLIKLISNGLILSSEYNAKQMIEPIIRLYKELYENIPSKENGYSANINNDKLREKAIQRLNWWLNKVLYNNEDELTEKAKSRVAEAESIAELILEDRKLKTKDNVTLSEKEIQSIFASTGVLVSKYGKARKVLTLRSFITSLMSMFIFKSLAYNFSSMITNRIEGIFQNYLYDSLGTFWTSGNLVYANKFMSKAFLRWSSKDRSKKYKVFEKFMKYNNILQDSSDELQRLSSITSNKRTEKLSPYYLPISMIEMKNQGEVVLSILMDVEIKDKNGNIHKVFNGDELVPFEVINDELRLKEEFRTEENIKTWELKDSDEYNRIYNKIIDALVRIAGDYDKLGGMYAKSTTFGKAFMLFKTWLPQAVWQRFANEHYIYEQKQQFKGRYRSHTKLSGAIEGALAGTLLGPWGIALGATIGFVWSNLEGIKSNINVFKELYVITKQMLRHLLLFPFNKLGIIKYVDNSDKAFPYLSKIDARNMAANVREMAIILGLLLFKLMIEALASDDEDDNWKYVYNLFENKLSQLISQATMYSNPKSLYETSTQVGLFNWLENSYNLVLSLEEAIEKKDYRKPKMYLRRMVLPQFMKYGGLQSFVERDWQKDWFDKLFSDDNNKKDKNKRKNNKKGE